MDIRTDLAIELHAKAVSELKGNDIDGIEIEEKKFNEYKLTRIKIINEKGEKILGKPIGNYVTVEFGRVTAAETDKFINISKCLECEIKQMVLDKCKVLPKKVLISGLGNADITADSLGPLTIKNIVVTRHLKKLSSELFESFGNVEIMAISMGVMAQTGMESADILKSIVDRMKPEAVIVIDALASNMLSRLASAIQIADTGICPGSGIGNSRAEIDSKTLGVPVISVGVPTMVEIATLVGDVAYRLGNKSITSQTVRNALGQESLSLVTPKDSAIMICDIAKMIGFAIDKVFIKDLEFEEIARLVN